MTRISLFVFAMLPVLAVTWRLDVYAGNCDDVSLDDAEGNDSSGCMVLSNVEITWRFPKWAFALWRCMVVLKVLALRTISSKSTTRPMRMSVSMLAGTELLSDSSW